jgi:hypothetical protein
VLVQDGGKYWITNPQEKNSFYFPVPWATMTAGTRTAQNLAIDLSAFKYRSRGEVQKLTPVEAAEISFRDRNIGDSLMTNGDFSNGLTGWSNSGMTGFTEVNEEGRIQFVNENGEDDGDYVYYQNIAVTPTGEDDKLAIEYDHRLVSKTHDPSDDDRYPKIQVKVYTSAGAFVGSGLLSRTGDDWKTVYTEIIITEDTNYQIRFYCDTDTSSPVTDSVIAIDNVRVNAIYKTADVTFDRFFKTTNSDSDFIKVEELELNFGDSTGDSDIAGFHKGANRTETWNRYGKTESSSINFLAGQNIIENFSKYKNYLRLDIVDPSDTINSYNLLTVQSRDYQIISHSIKYATGKRKEIQAELAEVLNAPVNTAKSESSLSSADGQSSGSTALVSGSTSIQIDDTVTSVSKVWSSSKVNTELGSKENSFSKNTAFNKNFGTSAGTVSEGNHNHLGIYAPVSHSHVISDVTGLQTALDGKADTDLSNATMSSPNRVLASDIVGNNSRPKVTAIGIVNFENALTGYPITGSADPIHDRLTSLEGGSWLSSGSDLYYAAGAVGVGAAPVANTSFYVKSNKPYMIAVDDGVASTGAGFLFQSSTSKSIIAAYSLTNSAWNSLSLRTQAGSDAILIDTSGNTRLNGGLTVVASTNNIYTYDAGNNGGVILKPDVTNSVGGILGYDGVGYCPLVLRTGSNLSQGIHIATGGHVGIGHNSPPSKLYVHGSKTSGFDAETTIRLQNSYTGAFGGATAFVFGMGTNTGSTSAIAQIVATYDNWNATNSVGGKLQFYTKDSSVSSTPSVRMTIIKTGAVGIMTDNPQYGRLQIQGTGSAQGLAIYKGSGSDFRIYHASDDEIQIIRGGVLDRGLSMAANGYVGVMGSPSASYPLNVNGTVNASDFRATSDRRLKKQIKPMSNASLILNNLSGVTYKWKKSIQGHDNKLAGFIAQDVEKWLPEAVRIDNSGTYGLDYNAFSPVLVEGWKDHEHKIDQLTADCAEYKDLIASLIIRVAQLEKKIK